MNRSLQGHLSRMLCSTVLLTALMAAAISFGLAYLEATDFQDETLREVAAIAAGQDAAESLRRAPTETESYVRVLHLQRSERPKWLPATLTPGFHTLETDQGRLRVFAGANQVVVAQPTEARDEIAANSALRSFVPMLLLLPMLAWLIVRIVRRELGPVIRLAQRLDEQSADCTEPLSDAGLPREVTPFVHAINRLLVRVNGLISQQRRFIADAAHELRSPLAAISLQTQNLGNANSLETVRERLPALQEGIERARKLTVQLLDLARTQALDLDGPTFDLMDLVRDLLEEFLPVAAAKGIDLGLMDSQASVIAVAPEMLRQILRNALENALRYTPAGGMVSLRIYSADGAERIEVIDDGPGIPASERERVFDAFYRIPGTPDHGSGIGLAIARDAARRLGGKVSLHERPGQTGLVFRYERRACQPA